MVIFRQESAPAKKNLTNSDRNNLKQPLSCSGTDRKRTCPDGKPSRHTPASAAIRHRDAHSKPTPRTQADTTVNIFQQHNQHRLLFFYHQRKHKSRADTPPEGIKHLIRTLPSPSASIRSGKSAPNAIRRVKKNSPKDTFSLSQSFCSGLHGAICRRTARHTSSREAQKSRNPPAERSDRTCTRRRQDPTAPVAGPDRFYRPSASPKAWRQKAEKEP